MKGLKLGRRTLMVSALAGAIGSMLPMQSALASGGSSGPHVSFGTQGHIGEIIVNPYNIAPLTAIIRNGGYGTHGSYRSYCSQTQWPRNCLQS